MAVHGGKWRRRTADGGGGGGGGNWRYVTVNGGKWRCGGKWRYAAVVTLRELPIKGVNGGPKTVSVCDVAVNGGKWRWKVASTFSPTDKGS